VNWSETRDTHKQLNILRNLFIPRFSTALQRHACQALTQFSNGTVGAQPVDLLECRRGVGRHGAGTVRASKLDVATIVPQVSINEGGTSSLLSAASAHPETAMAEEVTFAHAADSM
jgi:hypothetical protein